MGSSKDDTKAGTQGSGLHDSTTTSTGSRRSTGTGTSTSSRLNANSGIYDVSRMTNVKSPVDPFGHNVSHFTKIRGEDADRREKSKSEMIRVILIALAVPMIAGAIYLSVSGQYLHIDGVTPDDQVMNPIENEASNRSPATKATLPAILPFEAAPAPLEIAIVGQNGIATASENTVAVEPRRLKIELDSNGTMVSPFSVELNENGDEIARTELSDRLVYLPSIPMGQFESAIVLSKVDVPSNFTSSPQTRIFVFSDEERRRVSRLRAIAPEVKKYLNEEDSFSTSRLSTATQSVTSFTPNAKLTQSRIDDMYTELKWMRAASLARDISGDRSVERRLLDSLMGLARSYKPAGSPLTELPLLDALYAYDHVRHLWRTPDQAIIDNFFRDIVDAQFTRIKSEKVYNETHAAHILFALSVGYVIQNSAFQLHGLTQYSNHIERSKLFAQDSFGPDDVRTLNSLLRSAYVLERAGNVAYKSMKLHQAAGTLFTASQAETKLYRLKTLGLAAYFRSDMYPLLAQITLRSGIANSRFGGGESALLAASRHADATLLPGAAHNLRLPTSTAPTKLPPKRK